MYIVFILSNIFENILFFIFRPTTIVGFLICFYPSVKFKCDYLFIFVFSFLLMHSLSYGIFHNHAAFSQLFLPLFLFEYSRRNPLSRKQIYLWFALIFISLVADSLIGNRFLSNYHKLGFMMEANTIAYVNILLFFHILKLYSNFTLYLYFLCFISTLLLVSTSMSIVSIFIFFYILNTCIRKSYLLRILFICIVIFTCIYFMETFFLEFNKYLYRINHSGHTLIASISSYRSETLMTNISSFLQYDWMRILFGFNQIESSELYVEIDFFSQLLKFGIIPGSIFSLYLVIKVLPYILKMDLFFILLFSIFMILSLSCGHFLNRPVAMFTLGSFLGFKIKY